MCLGFCLSLLWAISITACPSPQEKAGVRFSVGRTFHGFIYPSNSQYDPDHVFEIRRFRALGYKRPVGQRLGCGILLLVLPTGPFSPMLAQVKETRQPPMDDIFISYATVDRPVARRLAGALEACGWSVWWDHRNLHSGEHYDRIIEEAISTARAVVVVWSPESTKSDWVRAEAAQALEENKLVPVQINGAVLPLRFRNIQTIDLSSWIGKAEAESFEWLVKDLRYRFGPANSSNRSDISTASGKQVPGFPKVEDQSLTDQDENNGILPSSTGTTANRKVRKVIASNTEWELEELKGATNKLLAGQFTLSEVVHPGKFSLVFRGHFNNEKDHKVAIKVLRRNSQINSISSVLHSALLKAQDQAGKHQSLIDIVCLSWEDDLRCIVMDYIEWPTLEECLCKCPGKRLEPIFTARLLSDLADAQGAAHARGLPLGSLAPREIHVRLSEDGEPQAIRISPFRIDALLTSFLGLTDGIPIPLRWDALSRLPPELYYGHRPDKENYDSAGQYFLGLLGLELLRGSKPVEVCCLAELEQMKVFFLNPHAFFIDSANGVDPWIEHSPALAFVISRLLEHEPSKRYASSKKAAEELKQVAEGQLPQSAREEIALGYDTVVSSEFAERFYNRLFNSESGERFRKMFLRDIQLQHIAFAKMLRSIDAYNPGIGHSPLEETFERHANDYGLTEADIDVFRKVFVKEISATYPDAGRKCEAWNVMLHHAFTGLKRVIAAKSSRSSIQAGTR
jgi:hypothetical protein